MDMMGQTFKMERGLARISSEWAGLVTRSCGSGRDWSDVPVVVGGIGQTSLGEWAGLVRRPP